jgi:putative CocE/NonD family hydrolase
MSQRLEATRLRAALFSAWFLLAAAPVWSAPVVATPPSGHFAGLTQEAWIPMADGVSLAADIYLPQGAEPGARFPVLLEYTPYRKTESRGRNHGLYSYFVEHGYAVARVDIRGTGNSEGRLIPYEYSEIEQGDGEAVIDWLSHQPWSNGNVGMFGISWGGFNAIQTAVRQPPALKAIIAVDATEDLYQEDVHYMDGILHIDSWEMTQDLDNARPGAPDYVIDEAFFANRFDTEPWMLTYLGKQRDGPFWDRASARDKHDRIRIPAFHIGGWYDGYRDSLPRLIAKSAGPVKAMIGPWIHAWPHQPYPEPGMEWRREAVRWFDQWLKGVDTGIADEPPFAVYVRDWHPPGPRLEYAPGRWRWEAGWPLERIQEQVLFARQDHTLSAERPEPAVHQLRYVPSAGVEAGGPVMWWGDVAPDQRPTDAFSLVYDSAPLSGELEILGLPLAQLQVSADAARANWIARLSDVAPDGTVTLVAGAAFNGAHRRSANDPEPLLPGEWFPLAIEMHFTSWVFPAGHRIRLAINNAQWPMLWPSPHPMTTRLKIGGPHAAMLTLPVVPAADNEPAPSFAPPQPSPDLPGYVDIDLGTSSGYGEISAVTRNPATGEAIVVATNNSASEYPWGREEYREKIEHRTSETEPWRTAVKGSHEIEVRLPARTLLWQAELDFSSDRENFHYHYTRRLLENGALLREKTWNQIIPRDFQ